MLKSPERWRTRQPCPCECRYGGLCGEVLNVLDVCCRSLLGPLSAPELCCCALACWAGLMCSRCAVSRSLSAQECGGHVFISQSSAVAMVPAGTQTCLFFSPCRPYFELKAKYYLQLEVGTCFYHWLLVQTLIKPGVWQQKLKNWAHNRFSFQNENFKIIYIDSIYI